MAQSLSLSLSFSALSFILCVIGSLLISCASLGYILWISFVYMHMFLIGLGPQALLASQAAFSPHCPGLVEMLVKKCFLI